MAVQLPESVRQHYESLVDQLQGQYRQLPADRPVRLAKKTSNLFRVRQPAAGAALDVSGFSGVLHVDAEARTADVLGMTTYEELVDETLAYGLMPLVVPELKTITLGGAVTGLGVESTSFRNGCPHESVLEMDVLTGTGDVVTVTPDGGHADLFHGFPNSYGSLGYALRLRIELQPVRPFVALRHVRVPTAGAAADLFADVVESGRYEGSAVDFLDGAVYSEDDIVVTLGSFVDEAPYTSDYTGQQIYYRSQQTRRTDYLTVRDYLWRWDTDWFWCSRALGVQRPMIRRLIPNRYLRSDVYFRAVGWERRNGFLARVDRMRGKPLRETVIQDIEVPIQALPEFLTFFHNRVGILPIWLCPMRQRDPDARWDLYQFDPATTYVNVGFWSSVERSDDEAPDAVNRAIEAEVDRLGGRKSLYSDAFYDEDDFWRIYNGEAYRRLKKEYDPDSRFLDLYAKTVGRG